MIFLTLFGWKVNVEKIKPVKKSIIIEAPHTSNWDFFIGIIAALSINLKFKFLIKKEWNKPIIGKLLSKLGAIFIDRSKKTGVTEEIASLLNQIEEGHIIFTPEGTRSKREKWKTGFYYIALNAQLPISIAYIDYKSKQLGIHDVIHPTGNINEDCNILRDFYKTITPKNKQNYEKNWKI